MIIIGSFACIDDHNRPLAVIASYVFASLIVFLSECSVTWSSCCPPCCRRCKTRKTGAVFLISVSSALTVYFVSALNLICFIFLQYSSFYNGLPRYYSTPYLLLLIWCYSFISLYLFASFLIPFYYISSLIIYSIDVCAFKRVVLLDLRVLALVSLDEQQQRIGT
jgi:hypothetical protein